MLLSVDETSDLAHDLRDGPNVVEIVQRHRDFEVILELADQFKNLERIEAEVGEQLALRGGLDRPSADAFEDVNRVLLEPIRGSGGFGSGQAPKCSMNAGTRATDEPRNCALAHRIRFIHMPRAAGAVHQTIILAAGVGVRLGGSSAGTPKPLLTVAGVPLLAHALAHAAASGCRDAIVVVGHEGTRVREAVEAMAPPIDVQFVTNPDPTTPNGDSLLAAEALAADRFFLQMADHVFAEPVLPRLTSSGLNGATAGHVLVDRAPVNLDLSDATKVRLAGSRVTAIGKGIDSWDAIDAGCFVLTRSVFAALRAVSADEPRTVSAAMRRLAERGALGAAEIGGVRWVDVDTPGDRAEAEAVIASCSAAVSGPRSQG